MYYILGNNCSKIYDHEVVEVQVFNKTLPVLSLLLHSSLLDITSLRCSLLMFYLDELFVRAICCDFMICCYTDLQRQPVRNSSSAWLLQCFHDANPAFQRPSLGSLADPHSTQHLQILILNRVAAAHLPPPSRYPVAIVAFRRQHSREPPCLGKRRRQS